MQTKTVTRVEIVDTIGPAFIKGSVDRTEILAAATSGQARPEVLELLGSLPDRRFGVVNELWEELRHVPVD